MQAFENITGKNNPELIRAASLKDKKYRRKYGAFLADGIKLFSELCESEAEICNVWINENAKDRILPKIEELLKKRGNISVRIAAPSAFLKLTDEEASEGIVCEARFLPRHTHAEYCSLKEGERALMLSSLRDPGNLGTVARSALAFNISRLILSSDCVDIYSQKTLRAAMGAIFKLDITVVDDMEKTAFECERLGRRVFAAELRDNSVSLLDAGVKGDDVFIIGNEGHGIPESLSAVCSDSVFIPISSQSESLNAAAAATVLLWHQSIAEG